MTHRPFTTKVSHNTYRIAPESTALLEVNVFEDLYSSVFSVNTKVNYHFHQNRLLASILSQTTPLEMHFNSVTPSLTRRPQLSPHGSCRHHAAILCSCLLLQVISHNGFLTSKIQFTNFWNIHNRVTLYKTRAHTMAKLHVLEAANYRNTLWTCLLDTLHE